MFLRFSLDLAGSMWYCSVNPSCQGKVETERGKRNYVELRLKKKEEG